MPPIKKSDYKERHKYACHKSKAKHRGVDFELTFDEWWDIWQQSGKWEERGVGKNKYCMSRYNDVGPYKVGNVFIQSMEQNSIEGMTGRKCPRTIEHQRKLEESLKKRFADPDYVSPHKGRPRPDAALSGKKGAKKQSETVTGRKRKYLPDGSWKWEYPKD